MLAVLLGTLIAMQGPLNAALGKTVGLWETSFLNHAVGFLFAALLLLVFRVGDGNLALLPETSPVTWLGGVLGVGIVYLASRIIPQLGVAPATTLIMVTQLILAASIDQLGLFGLKQIPFTWHQGVGILLLAGGTWLILKH